MYKFVLACLGFVFLGACDNKPVVQSSPEEAAKAGLTQFQAILKAHPNPASLGVTKEQSNEIGLGMPLDVYMVYLTDLKNFDGSNAITRDTGSKFYPIVVGNNVVSSLYVGEIDKTRWEATTFGNPAAAKAISALKGDYIIKVPALKVTLVASRTKDATIVTPIADDARFSFHAGQSLSLNDALLRMKPDAMKTVEDAPN